MKNQAARMHAQLAGLLNGSVDMQGMQLLSNEECDNKGPEAAQYLDPNSRDWFLLSALQFTVHVTPKTALNDKGKAKVNEILDKLKTGTCKFIPEWYPAPMPSGPYFPNRDSPHFHRDDFGALNSWDNKGLWFQTGQKEMEKIAFYSDDWCLTTRGELFALGRCLSWEEFRERSKHSE
jgi:hypothetical protein